MTKAVIILLHFHLYSKAWFSYNYDRLQAHNHNIYGNHDHNCGDHRDRNFSCSLNKTIKKINGQYRNNGTYTGYYVGTDTAMYQYQLHTVQWITKNTGVLPNFNVHQTISLMKGEPLGGKGLTLLISESQWYDIYLKHLK